MDRVPFVYGGLHFIPERQFAPVGQHHSMIPLSRIGADMEFGLCGPHPGEFAYSHEGFYAASTIKDCDIFRCIENGHLYVPCEDGLRLCEEPPNRERGWEHGR